MVGAEVIVVGAGPVGQTTALLLARWGVPVTLVDSESSRSPAGSKSICQQRDVLDVWAHVGAHAIIEEGTTWTTARTFYQGRQVHQWSFPLSEGTPPFVNISQARTEEILDDRIAEQPLITTRRGAEVISIEPAGGRPRLGLADGGGLSADYVVVCTGAHESRLRGQLGVRFTGTSYPDQFLICDIAAVLPDRRDERHFHFDPASNPGRQILIHPCPNDTYRIDWQLPDGPDDITVSQRIRTVIGDASYTLLWTSRYRFHSRTLDTMYTDRIFFAGDAAHLVAPFGARGLNSGIADAENLAWKIACHAHGWAPETLLASYHQERHTAAVENQSVVDATMAFLAPHTESGWRHRREVLAAAATDPQAAARIDSGRFAEPFWYDTSPLTTPDPHRPCHGRPSKGAPQSPAPGVICPDTVLPSGSGLRESLRGRFTLITAAGDADWFHRATTAPTTVVDLTALDATGTLADRLGLRPGEAWLVRPDAHLAATMPRLSRGEVRAAMDRALGAG